MSVEKSFYRRQAENLIPALKRRQMDGYYFETMAEAKAFIKSDLLKEGDTIAYGGSQTFEAESGLMQELSRDARYHFIDRTSELMTVEEKNARIINSDVFFMSTNAITLDGQLANIDGRGNRVCYLMYGPKSVIVLTSMNKVEADLDAAIHRARNIAAPMNCIRLDRNTPCRLKGHCMDCLSPESICANIVITRRSHIPGRIKVVLVGEKFGY